MEGNSSRFLNPPVINFALNSLEINCNHEELSPRAGNQRTAV